MGTRISTDLSDPRLIKLLRAEANERDTTIKEVLTRALEAYFADRLEGDGLLSEWKAAGLLHPSLLRMAKIATIDEELIDRAIGCLAPPDHDAARAAFQGLFADWPA